MYIASIIQQYPQQISTESLAGQKEKIGCWQLYPVWSILFFFPIFVPHSTDSTKSTVESVSGIMTIMPDSVTEATVMYGGVASGTKIRIIRICGAKYAATPPNPNRRAK